MGATETSRFYSYFGKEGLAGGLNVSDNPLIVGPAEMTEAKNILISQSLARKKRFGQENYHTGSFEGTASYPTIGQPIRGLIQYWRFLSGNGDVADDLFLHSEEKVWSIPNRADAAEDRTGAAILSGTSIPYYQIFEGILYFATSNPGVDGYKKWNGLTAIPGDIEDAVDPPDGPMKYLQTFRARMFAAGVASFPFRLYMSAALDAEDWAGSDATSFDLDYDGDPEGITAIFPEYQGRLYIATRRSIYELSVTDPTDLSTFIIQRITKGIGCVGHRMWTATPNDILFWSDRGLHSLKKTITSDQTEIEFLSRDIQRLVTNMLNFSIIKQGQTVWEESQNLIVTTVPGAGQQTNNLVLVYNITYGLWTVWQGINARSLAPILIDQKQYIGAGREDGRITILNEDRTDDLGVGFAANFKTGKLFPNGDIINQKRFMSVIILASSTTVSDVQVSWSVDTLDGTRSNTKSFQLGTGSETLGETFVLGQSTLGIGRFIPNRLSIDEVGYNIQFNISVSGDSDIEFYGFILEVDESDTHYT